MKKMKCKFLIDALLYVLVATNLVSALSDPDGWMHALSGFLIVTGCAIHIRLHANWFWTAWNRKGFNRSTIRLFTSGMIAITVLMAGIAGSLLLFSRSPVRPHHFLGWFSLLGLFVHSLGKAGWMFSSARNIFQSNSELRAL